MDDVPLSDVFTSLVSRRKSISVQAKCSIMQHMRRFASYSSARVALPATYPLSIPLEGVLRKDGTIGPMVAKFELEFNPMEQKRWNPNLDTYTISSQYFDVFLKLLQADPEIKNCHLLIRYHEASCKLEKKEFYLNSESKEWAVVHSGKDENGMRLLKIDCTDMVHYGVLEVDLRIGFEYEQVEERARGQHIGYNKFQDNMGGGVISDLHASKGLKDLCDFTLVCDGKSFPCSKFILMARSEVFRAMLSNSETKESQMQQAVIEDCTPEALGIFLELLYTGEAFIPDQSLTVLFGLADRYQVHTLLSSLSFCLYQKIDLANCCELAILAHLHSESRLLNGALKFIKQNLAKLKKTPGWKEIEEGHPAILSKLLLLDLGK